MDMGPLGISNNGIIVDSRSKNIHIRDIGMSVEDDDYVSDYSLGAVNLKSLIGYFYL